MMSNPSSRSNDTNYYFADETFTLEVAIGEKQISVDPISIQEPRKPNLPVPPVAKCKSFLSFSLPNSASSSPVSKQKKKTRSKNDRLVTPLARQQSVALSNLERLRESHVQRSKSCGEGRACQPSVDFDHQWSTTSSISKLPESCRGANNNVVINHDPRDVGDQEEEDKSVKGSGRVAEVESSYEDNFKCGALCLFLPGFGNGKVKVVRAKKDPMEPQMEPQNGTHHGNMMVSQRVSLEKFECGSWRSSSAINYEEQYGDNNTSSNLFFDLPVEMIRCSNVNDTESPVTAAFVFDNNNKVDHQHPKGVLKNTSNTNSGQPRKSQDSSNSSRHVRFSTSSPTACPTSPTSCVTPRHLKARDDFNAFLKAQGA